MGNSAAVRVMGKGKILLRFASSKLLFRSNVLYVLFLLINLISGILFNEAGLKTILRDGKVVLSHHGVLLLLRP